LNHGFENIDNLDDDSDDDLGMSKFMVNMDQGERKKKDLKRIYDSKYKLPAPSKLNRVL
jgi:hypothetical protein